MAKNNKPKKGAITPKKKKAVKKGDSRPIGEAEALDKIFNPEGVTKVSVAPASVLGGDVTGYSNGTPVDPAVLNARAYFENANGVWPKVMPWQISGHPDGVYVSDEQWETWQLMGFNSLTKDMVRNPETGLVYISEPDKTREVKREFTGLERAFIYEYITNGYNKTQAVIDAGYDVNGRECAAAIGYENFRKPHIKAEIDRLISERLMSKEETLQRISQMARASLNDYLHTVKKAVRPTVKVSLRVLIERLKEKMEDQAKFIERAKITDTRRLDAFAGNLVRWNEEIIELEIQLERDPLAYEERTGPEVMEEVVEIDWVKLMNDKERGIIKSLKRDKNGDLQVELYGTDGALRDIGRYHGIFEKDNRRLNLNSEPLTDDEIVRLSKKLDNEY
jgi:phage terminase small subunit